MNSFPTAGSAHDHRHAGSHGAPGGITVLGIGSAMASVDNVTVVLAVEIVRAAAGEAFQMASTVVTGVLGVLADHGIDSRSVRTQNLSLGPRYDHRDNQAVITGYQATQLLSVTLDGLSGVDTMLTDLAARTTEGLLIRQVSLTAEHPREASNDARAAAMIDAREKATSLAALAGRPLGRVLEVVEEQHSEPRPVALMAHTTRDGATMPVAGGDEVVTVAVRVRFAWGDVG